MLLALRESVEPVAPTQPTRCLIEVQEPRTRRGDHENFIADLMGGLGDVAELQAVPVPEFAPTYELACVGGSFLRAPKTLQLTK